MSNVKRLLSLIVLVIFLNSCSSISQGRGVSDEAMIYAARTEMSYVKQGLLMYQAEDETSSFPPVSMVTSHADLYRILYPYLDMPEPAEASWTFVSYARALRDTFVLKGYAKDKNRTQIIATPTVLLPPP